MNRCIKWISKILKDAIGERNVSYSNEFQEANNNNNIRQ